MTPPEDTETGPSRWYRQEFLCRRLTEAERRIVAAARRGKLTAGYMEEALDSLDDMLCTTGLTVPPWQKRVLEGLCRHDGALTFCWPRKHGQKQAVEPSGVVFDEWLDIGRHLAGKDAP